MPLLESPPFVVQAPCWAGIGLRAELELGMWYRLPQPDWPADWWQRNMEQQILDPDQPPWPPELTERQMHVPGLT